jgi:ribose-phosphate pyrophosphokinase
VGFKSCIEKLTKVNIPMAFISKRPQSNTSTTAGSTEGEFSLVGDVKGKRCIVCDDIVDSGTTLLNVVRTLKANGAKRVYAYVTHGGERAKRVSLVTEKKSAKSAKSAKSNTKH